MSKVLEYHYRKDYDSAKKVYRHLQKQGKKAVLRRPTTTRKTYCVRVIA